MLWPGLCRQGERSNGHATNHRSGTALPTGNLLRAGLWLGVGPGGTYPDLPGLRSAGALQPGRCGAHRHGMRGGPHRRACTAGPRGDLAGGLVLVHDRAGAARSALAWGERPEPRPRRTSDSPVQRALAARAVAFRIGYRRGAGLARLRAAAATGALRRSRCKPVPGPALGGVAPAQPAHTWAGVLRLWLSGLRALCRIDDRAVHLAGEPNPWQRAPGLALSRRH